MKTLRRTLHPETRILDAKAGLIEYVASDETLDSFREIIRAEGWRFTHFNKNAPFVDSHDYYTIERQVGRVVDFKVTGKKLVETVKWAVDVAENSLAQLGWKMTEAGYLKAVSVGFWPVKMVTRWDKDRAETRPVWDQQLAELNLPAEAKVNAIYMEQEQVELSACIVGANPNALARSYKAGVITDADLETLSSENASHFSAAAVEDALAAAHLARQRRRFLTQLQTIIEKL